MWTLTMAMSAAKATPGGTPEHAAARDICLLRGLDPDALSSLPIGTIGMANWQRVIAEQLLESDLRETMMQPATIPFTAG